MINTQFSKSILLVLVLLIASGMKAKSPFIFAQCYTKEGYIAAISEEYLDDVVRYSIDKDYEAINKLLRARVIFQMTDGVKVHLVNAHLFSGVVEFRLPGQTVVLWTVREGLKCN